MCKVTARIFFLIKIFLELSVKNFFFYAYSRRANFRIFYAFYKQSPILFADLTFRNRNQLAVLKTTDELKSVDNAFRRNNLLRIIIADK